MNITLNDQEKIWDDVLAIVKVDRHVFDSFLSKTKITKIEGNKIVILTDTSLSATFLTKDNRYKSLIQEVVEQVTQTNYELEFTYESEDSLASQKNSEAKKPRFFQACRLDSRYTFDNFVVGESNKEAVQASVYISAKPGETYNPLFIYSKSGLGKTHLLHAIGNYIHDKKPFYKILYITTDAFIDEFVKFVRGDQQDESLKDYLKTADVLLIDDIQFLTNKEKTSEMFFYIFNYLISNGKQVVLTSDCPPNELKGLEERLVSRFNMGLSVNIKNPDLETSLKILSLKIEANGLNINNFDYDGLVYLAENFSKNVRELEGALNRLIFYTITVKRIDKITIDTIKEAINGISSSKSPKDKLTEEQIIQSVGDYYNLTTEQIKSKVRTQQIALARQISMYMCRSLLNTPYVQIGHIFGGRDHSTVMTSVEKIETMLKTDTQLTTAIQQIKDSLK
jgi:chromosomal replication initiator protein